MKLRNRESLPVLGLFLGGIALLAALVLAVVSQLTAEPIRKSQESKKVNEFKRLRLPEFDRIGDVVDIDGKSFYPVEKDGKTVGFVGSAVTRKGYAGEIEALVGFDLAGKITGVQILRQKETPGLGAEVCSRKFQRTIFNLSEEAPEIPAQQYLDQYNGKNAQEAGAWKTSADGGEFIYKTGATVTSRAVTSVVDEIASAFAKSGLTEMEKKQ